MNRVPPFPVKSNTAIMVLLLAPLLALLLFYYWLGQSWPLEWDDEVHFSAVTDSIMRAHFPSVPELSAEKGIYWMPFFSNFVQAFIFKICGVNSVYSLYQIRPYIVLPVVAFAYFLVFRYLKITCNSNFISIIFTSFFLMIPASAGPLNTLRPEGLCVILIVLTLLYWLNNNIASSFFSASLALLTHPLAGIVSFIILIFCIVKDLFVIALPLKSLSLSSKSTGLLRIYSRHLKTSFAQDQWKYILLAILFFALVVNVYSVISTSSGFERLHQHLAYQFARKATRNLSLPLIGLAKEAFILFLSYFSYIMLFCLRLMHPHGHKYIGSQQARAIESSLIAGSILMMVPAVFGQELWYSVYRILGLIIIANAQLIIGGYLLYGASLAVDRASSHLIRSCKLTSIDFSAFLGFICAASALTILCYLALTFKPYSFGGMDLSARHYNLQRKIIAREMAFEVKDMSGILQVDPFAYRLISHEMLKFRNAPRLVNIPPVIKDSPNITKPILVLTGPGPKWLYDYGWDLNGPNGFVFHKSCRKIAGDSIVNGYICG